MREVDPSKKLLLRGVIRDDNLANNGEVLKFDYHIGLNDNLFHYINFLCVGFT